MGRKWREREGVTISIGGGRGKRLLWEAHGSSDNAALPFRQAKRGFCLSTNTTTTSTLDRNSCFLSTTLSDFVRARACGIMQPLHACSASLLQHFLNLDGDNLSPLFPFRLPYTHILHRPVHHAAVFWQQHEEEEKRVRWRSAPAVTVACPPLLPPPSPPQHDSTTR